MRQTFNWWPQIGSNHREAMRGELIVAIFPSRRILTKALDRLMELPELDILHAAIIARARDGQLIVLDDDLGADEGGVAGGLTGMTLAALGMMQLGALTLPGIGPVVAVGAGALVGGVVGHMTGRFAANLVDFNARTYPLDTLGQRLVAGQPALVLEVSDHQTMLPILTEELRRYRADLVERAV